MTERQPLKIGTRGSPLALKQTTMVEEALQAAHPDLRTELVIIRTSGDWRPEDGEKRLSEAEGGKGLFAREIERALKDGEIDCAVHSLKDMPSFLEEGLAITHVMERADPCDAFISYDAAHFTALKQGAVIGTSSLRRQAFLLAERPDLNVVALRGNVQTRLEKLRSGQVDATFLAMAGLARLGLAGDFIHPLSTESMLPACAQGIIGVERRADDEATSALLQPIHHAPTGFAAMAERAALQVLDGSCRTPIGAYARFDARDGAMVMDLKVASEDGQQIFAQSARATITSDAQAEDFGRTLAQTLKPRVPADIFV